VTKKKAAPRSREWNYWRPMTNDNAFWEKTQARWIRLAGTENAKNLYLEFAKEFDSSGKDSLEVHITAFSEYELYVNGSPVRRGPAHSSPQLCFYDEFTVPAEQMRTGKNCLAVLLFHDGRDTHTIQGFEYGEPGLLLHARCGNVQIQSGTSWQVRRSPAYSGEMMVSQWGSYKEFYHGERRDAWAEPGIDRSAWEAAVEFAEPASAGYVQALMRLDVPPLEETLIRPERLVQVCNNLGKVEAGAFPAAYGGQSIRVLAGEPMAAPSVTFDFGTMVVGYPEIETSGGTHIYEVWYGESLDTYRLDVIRQPSDGLWHAFQRRAFRYVTVKVIAQEGPVEIRDVRLRRCWYAYNPGGICEGPDEKLNRIISASLYTTRVNTSYHYEDCPWRERALWVFDMRLMALVNYYHYGNPELVRKCLRQMFALQEADGSTPATGPKQNPSFLLDFCLHLVATLREYYGYTGDSALVEELMPAVDRLHAFLCSAKADDGLLDAALVAHKGGAFLDWSAALDKGGRSTVLNALYAAYLSDYARLAEVCGRDGSVWKKERQQVARRANELLYDEASGLYRDTWADGKLSEKASMQSGMAALYAGFVPEDKAPALAERLMDPHQFQPPFGPSFYLMVFDALARLGMQEKILQCIRFYWGRMLEMGATTLWEVFDPNSPQWLYPHPFLGNTPTYEMDYVPVSTCHGWSAVPAYATPRHLLGVDLLHLDEGKVVVHTGLPALLERYRWRTPLRGGTLDISFYKEGEILRPEVLQAPEGVEVVTE